MQKRLDNRPEKNFIIKSVMRYLKIILSALAISTSWVSAQIIFSEDFDGFDGSGFQSNPTTGQLDSDFWSITGLSDGDLAFGGTETNTDTDFTRGTSTGGVSTGGIYAFDLGNNSGDYILGVQPIGADFAPGDFTLKFTNNTGSTLDGIIVSYDIVVYNDQGRSSSFNFAHKDDSGDTFSAITSLDFSTPQDADSSPTWTTTAITTTITGITLTDGDDYFLQWSSDDVGGSGSRDQFGLNNVVVSAIPEPSTYALVFGSIALGIALWRKRRQAAA